MHHPAGAAAPDHLGWRAARTRQAILDAARHLFLTRGYAGTRISNITDACGISRAGFYTYFSDKREVFNLLGSATTRASLKALSGWDDLPRPCSQADVERWVRSYFDFLEVYGAFFLSPQSSPDEEDVRAAATMLTMRGCFLLGVNLRSRQATPTETPEALGLVVKAMLDRSWHQIKIEQLPVSTDDVVATVASNILAILDA